MSGKKKVCLKKNDLDVEYIDNVDSFFVHKKLEEMNQELINEFFCRYESTLVGLNHYLSVSNEPSVKYIKSEIEKVLEKELK